MGDQSDAVSPQRRDELLKRISRRSATIGERIPEVVTIGGEELHLKSFVWETKQQGVVPPEYRDRVQTVRARLKDERKRRKTRLEEADLTSEEAEELADSIVGIDRAISALKSLREPDLNEHAHEQYVQSNKRWIEFLNQLR